MSNRWYWFLAFPALFALRLAFGLWAPPVQPMEDELQTALIGLKFYATGAWPYYGNDIVSAPGVVSHLVTQDPGPLQAFLVAGPWWLWPDPLASFLFINLFSMAGFGLVAFYARKRFPQLPAWFVYPWALTLPWCLHYSTGMMNFSYSVSLSCLFFVAFFESIPDLGLGWITPPWANAWMGFALSGWVQLHRTWVLILPLLLYSFLRQWTSPRGPRALVYFLLGTFPLLSLILPTFLRPDYGAARDLSGFSAALNPANLKAFFTILVQYLAMACFEMPRFIGQHTVERFQFLTRHWLLLPGAFLWYFGILQVLVLAVFFFYPPGAREAGKKLRGLVFSMFLFIYACLAFTAKNPDLNTFYEIIPLVILYSFYVWDFLWGRPWGRALLVFAFCSSLLFEPAWILIRRPENASFYLRYREVLAQAITQRNDHLLGERRAGFLY